METWKPPIAYPPDWLRRASVLCLWRSVISRLEVGNNGKPKVSPLCSLFARRASPVEYSVLYSSATLQNAIVSELS